MRSQPSAQFQQFIQDCCNQYDLKLAHLDDKHAVLPFLMPSGRRQFLFITRYDSTLEFSVPTFPIAEGINDMPNILSSLLLQKSAQTKIGFWTIVSLPSGLAYSRMHNAELDLLNSKDFLKIVQSLVKECDELERSLLPV